MFLFLLNSFNISILKIIFFSEREVSLKMDHIYQWMEAMMILETCMENKTWSQPLNLMELLCLLSSVRNWCPFMTDRLALEI